MAKPGSANLPVFSYREVHREAMAAMLLFQHAAAGAEPPPAYAAQVRDRRVRDRDHRRAYAVAPSAPR